MKKRIAIGLCILLCLFCLYSCGNADPEEISYKPLFSEDGVYLEENFIFNAALPKEKGFELIKDGKTDCSIVYQATNDSNILMAIDDLHDYFVKICGDIEVKTDDNAASGKEIVVGKTTRGYDSKGDLTKVGAYIVEVQKEVVYIYAENTYGITNGVYGFMEDYLGCVFIDHDITYIPPVSTMVLEAKRDVQVPAFDRRDVGAREVWGYAGFQQKMRARPNEVFDPNGCHNSLNRISSEILAEHPEYYALLGGKRTSGNYLFQGPQLCFSNPEVVDLLEEAIVREQNNYTGQAVMWWDISQQDSMNYCTCEECRRMTQEAGKNPAAPIFNCVNTIARRHPDIKLSVLAYHYGSYPPENIVFEKNVMVKWCIMSSYGRNDYSGPLEDGNSSIAVKQYEEINGWSELVDHIYVWDYITNYFYYLLPFPCLDAMGPNMRLLRDCQVKGVLSLSSYNNRGAWDDLKANYAAHLLWNPEINGEEFINKFLTVYYGKDAMIHIRNIYKRMQETVSAPLCVYDFPFMHQKDYLSEENVNYYFEELDKAFELCQGNETYLKRLRYERLTILFTAILLKYGDKETLNSYKEEFGRLCEEFSITTLNEISSITVEDLIK